MYAIPSQKLPCANPIRSDTSLLDTDKQMTLATLITSKISSIPTPTPSHFIRILFYHFKRTPATFWYSLYCVMILILILPPLLLCGYRFVPSGSRFVPELGPLPWCRCSLVLVAECFSFVAWALVRCRCSLLDY
jgi:hypothetical protein